MNKVTVLGINGHIGHHAAQAFVAAGWQVTGFGRSNRHPIAGVALHRRAMPTMSTTCGRPSATARSSSTRCNLPYDQWDKGRMEAHASRGSSRPWATAARR